MLDIGKTKPDFGFEIEAESRLARNNWKETVSDHAGSK
jgi:hypothetical protein